MINPFSYYICITLYSLELKGFILYDCFRTIPACAMGLSSLAFAAGSLRASTTADLIYAMHGEAFAALKYAAYADVAREENYSQLVDLFARTPETERGENGAGRKRSGENTSPSTRGSRA